ncbi:MAG: hypothetical protein M3Z83_10080 [Actinomycetota bacterium]|nr:hypothetical protein [Actinomycetota bacterium]
MHVLLVGYFVREPWEQATWVVLSGAFVALRVSFTIKAFERFTREVATLTEGEFVYLDGPHGSFNLDVGPRGDDLQRPGPLVLWGPGSG